MLKFSRWILLGLCFGPFPAFAAKVTKVDIVKKVVIIDEGSETNFLKNSKVCFYNESNVKVGCAFIRTAKPKISFIKIKSDKLIAKIVVGLIAKLEAAPAAGTQGITAEPIAPVDGPVETAKSYVIALLAIPILDPVSYQNLIYEAPIAGGQSSSMWSSDSAVKSLGAGLEFGLGIKSFQLSFGVRTRFFIPKKISSDYADGDGDKIFEQYVDTTATGSSVGLWSDFYWLHVNSGVVNFRLGNGLDFDSSTVSFEAVQKSDLNTDSNILYQGKSTLTAISLRTLPSLDLVFGPVNLSLGAIIYIPLVQTPKFTLSASNDLFATQSLDPTVTPAADLEKALKHKAKPGAELILSTGIVF